MDRNASNAFGGNAQGVGEINPLEYPAVECPECGCKIFVPALMFFKVPGSLYGMAGQTVSQPMKVFVCRNCGALSPDDQAAHDELREKADKKKSDIII